MTFEEMKKIVVDTLNCEEDKVTMEASLTEDLEADSLDAVELNMALEDACGVSIPDEELAKLLSTGTFICGRLKDVCEDMPGCEECLWAWLRSPAEESEK